MFPRRQAVFARSLACLSSSVSPRPAPWSATQPHPRRVLPLDRALDLAEEAQLPPRVRARGRARGRLRARPAPRRARMLPPRAARQSFGSRSISGAAPTLMAQRRGATPCGCGNPTRISARRVPLKVHVPRGELIPISSAPRSGAARAASLACVERIARYSRWQAGAALGREADVGVPRVRRRRRRRRDARATRATTAMADLAERCLEPEQPFRRASRPPADDEADAVRLDFGAHELRVEGGAVDLDVRHLRARAVRVALTKGAVTLTAARSARAAPSFSTRTATSVLRAEAAKTRRRVARFTVGLDDFCLASRNASVRRARRRRQRELGARGGERRRRRRGRGRPRRRGRSHDIAPQWAPPRPVLRLALSHVTTGSARRARPRLGEAATPTTAASVRACRAARRNVRLALRAQRDGRRRIPRGIPRDSARGARGARRRAMLGATHFDAEGAYYLAGTAARVDLMRDADHVQVVRLAARGSSACPSCTRMSTTRRTRTCGRGSSARLGRAAPPARAHRVRARDAVECPRSRADDRVADADGADAGACSATRARAEGSAREPAASARRGRRGAAAARVPRRRARDGVAHLFERKASGAYSTSARELTASVHAEHDRLALALSLALAQIGAVCVFGTAKHKARVELARRARRAHARALRRARREAAARRGEPRRPGGRRRARRRRRPRRRRGGGRWTPRTRRRARARRSASGGARDGDVRSVLGAIEYYVLRRRRLAKGSLEPFLNVRQGARGVGDPRGGACRSRTLASGTRPSARTRTCRSSARLGQGVRALRDAAHCRHAARATPASDAFVGVRWMSAREVEDMKAAGEPFGAKPFEGLLDASCGVRCVVDTGLRADAGSRRRSSTPSTTTSARRSASRRPRS